MLDEWANNGASAAFREALTGKKVGIKGEDMLRLLKEPWESAFCRDKVKRAMGGHRVYPFHSPCVLEPSAARG